MRMGKEDWNRKSRQDVPVRRTTCVLGWLLACWSDCWNWVSLGPGPGPGWASYSAHGYLRSPSHSAVAASIQHTTGGTSQGTVGTEYGYQRSTDDKGGVDPKIY